MFDLIFTDSGDVEAANLTAEDACDQGSTEENTEEKVNETSKISVVEKSGRFSIRKMFSFGKSSANKAESNKTPETGDKEEKVDECEKKELEESKGFSWRRRGGARRWRVWRWRWWTLL